MLQMMFDYQYIDPGPDDLACANKRYFALNVCTKIYAIIVTLKLAGSQKVTPRQSPVYICTDMP